MAKKEIIRPLVPNWIEYDENTPWSEVDERLYTNFLKLHDELIEMDRLKLVYLTCYDELDKHIEEVRAALNEKVVPAIDIARDAADPVLPAYRLNQTGPAEALNASIDAANDAINAFQELLCTLEEDMKSKEETHAAFSACLYDEDDTLWESVHADHSLLLKGRHSIDYDAFERAEQRFAGSYDFHRRNWVNAVEFRDRTIGNYNVLLLEAKMYFRIWEEFGLRCLLISEITKEYETRSVAQRN